MGIEELLFGPWLQQRRRQFGLTQEALGKQVGLSADMIRKIEGEVRRPSVETAMLLARWLEVPATEQSAFLRFARGESSRAPAVAPPKGKASAPWLEVAPVSYDLPRPATRLIGRRQQVSEIAALVQQTKVQLVTLTGPGGVGKTRLALAVADVVRPHFPDGVLFIGLESISDHRLLLPTIAQTLDLKFVGDQPLLAIIVAFLRRKKLMLVLDNFEHVQAAGPVVANLVQAAPGLKVLVTSRASLQLQAEHTVAVEPLSVPEPRISSPEALSKFEVVQLFVERAQAVKAEFAITDANAHVVAEICARLDGLPLAIELAAARVTLLPIEALLQRLRNTLRVLTGGARDLPHRHQTLRYTIDWSYNLLKPAAQVLFARMSVFEGSGTLEAVESICGTVDTLALDVLDDLQSLIDNSFVRQAPSSSAPRYRILQTIREYGVEVLENSGQAEVIRRAHAEYFLALAEAAEADLGGPKEDARLQALEAEYGNFQAALMWSLERGVDRELGLRLAGALWPLWAARGRVSEGRRWLTMAVAGDGVDISGRPAPRAKALFAAGNLAWIQGDYATARTLTEESLGLWRVLGDTRGIAAALSNYGIVARAEGDNATAHAALEESLMLRRSIGDRRGIGWALQGLGDIALDRQDYAAAQKLLEEALALRSEDRYSYGIVYTLNSLGKIAYDQQDHGAARTLFGKSLMLAHTVRDPQGIVEGLEALAGVAADGAQPTRAVRLFGAAEALRKITGVIRVPADHTRYTRSLGVTRAQLDTVTFAAEWRIGRGMTPEEVVAYAAKASLEEP